MNGSSAIEIVIEAVLDRGADGRLRFGKEILDGVCEHVRGGVPQFGKRGPAIVNAGVGNHGAAVLAPAGPKASAALREACPSPSASSGQAESKGPAAVLTSR